MAPLRVIFDLYGTLVASIDAGPAPAPGAGERVPTGETWRDVAVRLLRVDGAAFEAEFPRSTHARERGSITFVDALAGASRAAGGSCSPSDLRAMEAHSIDGLRSHLHGCVRPGALRLLASLRGLGHEVWLCSNASSDTAAALPGSPLASALTGVVISSAVGCAKPEPAIYAAATGGVPAVFVGDGGSSELTGARDAGLYAVQVPRYRGDHTTGFDAEWDGPRARTLEHVAAVVRDRQALVDSGRLALHDGCHDDR